MSTFVPIVESTVLIIGDEDNLRSLVARSIELEGYHVIQAKDGKSGLKQLAQENVQVVVSDVRLPDTNGLELTAQIKKQFPDVEVIVLTAFGTIQDGVQAMKAGAFDYLTKGDHMVRIIPLIAKACERARLRQKVRVLESKVTERYGFGQILGNSSLLTKSVDLAKKVAVTDSTVLLTGETGTGKEVFAQAIHYESPRKSKPFVALNCSAFSRDLLESELFGHAEGAFTGAIRVNKGYLEEANEGTLFLDEIGEMNPELQVKLLRVIETGDYYRVGDSRQRHANVRFIAATNRNLEQEVEEGHFRRDLFYRLSAFTIELAPLRQRPADIPVLTQHFIRQFALKTDKQSIVISPDFINALRQHPWKGNIRELKNIIERCLILADKELTPALLPSDFTLDDAASGTSLASVERNHIVRILRQTGGNKTEAARLLGIGLTTLYRKIEEYKLQQEAKH